MSLRGGEVDLDRRSIRFAQFALSDGTIALALDAQGRGDWTGITLDASVLDLRGLQQADRDQQINIGGLKLDNKSVSVQQGDAGMQMQAPDPLLQLTVARAQQGQRSARLAQ